MKGEYSVKFEIDEPTKADEGAYKFVIQNEKGETTSDSMEVKEIPVEKGKIFIKHVTINLHSFDSHTRAVFLSSSSIYQRETKGCKG